MTAMDYKYIEQLLERYWECETSTEEEQILIAFFSHRDIPNWLARYKGLFVYETQQAHISLGEEFDNRLLQAIGSEQPTTTEATTVKVKRITLMSRLRPLYHAAAAVAIVTLLGTAAQHSFQPDSTQTVPAGWDYNQSAYKDSYQAPQKAYEEGMKALELFKQGPKTAVADSAGLKANPQ